MEVFTRKLKVDKTDAYELDVTRWAGSESITSFSVETDDPYISVGVTTISGGKLSVLLTGVSEGIAELHFEYTTATRSDCFKAKVVVVAGC